MPPTRALPYEFLAEEDQHDQLIATFAAWEHDHWQHTTNKERFEAILADTTISPSLRQWIQQLLNDTRDRLHQVEHLMAKTRPQLPTGEKYDAAKARHLARVAAARAKL